MQVSVLFKGNREMNLVPLAFGVYFYSKHMATRLFNVTNAAGLSVSIDTVRRVISNTAIELRDKLASFNGIHTNIAFLC